MTYLTISLPPSHHRSPPLHPPLLHLVVALARRKISRMKTQPPRVAGNPKRKRLSTILSMMKKKERQSLCTVLLPRKHPTGAEVRNEARRSTILPRRTKMWVGFLARKSFFLWWKNDLVFTWSKDMIRGRFRVVLILCLVVLFPVFFVFTATASSNTNIEEKTRYTVCGS